MANNTLKLHRTHYSISETAKILGCDEQDVIYIADGKRHSIVAKNVWAMVFFKA